MALDGKLEKIKDNVWKLEKDGKRFSVKRYHSNSTAMKVQRVHDALHSVSFPHIVDVVSQENQLTFVQPWLDGAKAVNFKKRADRTDSLVPFMHFIKPKHNSTGTPHPIYIRTHLSEVGRPDKSFP